MIKKYSIILILNIINSFGSYSQKIGIGTDLPTEMLDVNGKVRIRSIEELSGTSIRPLYINSDGIIGRKVEEAPLTQIFSASSKVEYRPIDGVNQFNSGNNVLAPLNINDATVNNLDISSGGNHILKVEHDGFYFYNAFINLVCTVEKPNQTVYLFAKIEYSRNNGTSWNIITATRLVTALTVIGGQMVIITLPPTTIKHLKGDLIRLSISRSRSVVINNPVMGDPLTNIYFSYTNSVTAYTLIINKI
ncbi:hypothetical protein HMPREF9713_00504 [Myroides odoratimimus CCUG 12700]|uniref:hypothetical protein n=1 Tax=Myroides odoratimimus TaxID=76832 RepID=UPI0003532D64|nr:hypothetical protein [Myroides odoratimimus]EPH13557.1 hypothetical protein HMPREF9713_00504 [Myroides odoratimimus CCUG 12700]